MRLIFHIEKLKFFVWDLYNFLLFVQSQQLYIQFWAYPGLILAYAHFLFARPKKSFAQQTYAHFQLIRPKKRFTQQNGKELILANYRVMDLCLIFIW